MERQKLSKLPLALPVNSSKKERVRVSIYTPTHVWVGYIYRPRQWRLLDVLNGMSIGVLRISGEFLPVSEARIRSLDGKEATVPSAYVNKTNILFVKESEDGQTKGLGGEAGHKPYPFVPRASTVVKVYVPFYTLVGQMHCAKGERVADVLNSGLRFLPLTNVEIYSSADSSTSGISFTAINKSQIFSLEEVGIR